MPELIDQQRAPGAVAGLLYHMLKGQGNPFPLTGNGGIKYYPADNGWIREPEIE